MNMLKFMEPQKEKFIIALIIILVPYMTLFIYNIENQERFYMPDSGLYEELAINLLEGRGFTNYYDEPELVRTPGYPLFVAASYFIIKSPAFVVFLQIILLLITGTIIYKITKSLGYNQNASLVSMLAFCLSGVVLVNILFVLSEAFYTFLITLFFYFILKYHRGGEIKFLLLSGFLISIAALTRPISIYFVFILVILLIFFSSDRRRVINHVTVFAILILVILSPWLFRTYNLTGKPIFSTVSDLAIIIYVYPVYGEINGLGYNDAIAGLLTEASEYYNWNRTIDIIFDDDGLARESVEKISQAREYAVSYAVSHPLLYLKYHLLGMILTFTPNSVNEFSYIIEGVNRYGMNIEILKNLTNLHYIGNYFVHVIFKFYEVLIAIATYLLAFIGIKHFIRNKKNCFLVSLLLTWVLYNINLTSTYGLDRYSVPLLPLIAVFAGVGFSETDWEKLFEGLKGRMLKTLSASRQIFFRK